MNKTLTRDEIIARNLEVVEAHFHNENPEDIDKALALYADDISWEAPSRGIVMTDPTAVRAAYLDIFKTVSFQKSIQLRRFATEDFVFDDQIVEATVVDELMPNLPYPVGSKMSVRLVHMFEMKDGRIASEIAYEIWRKLGSLEAVDFVPDGAEVTLYDD